MRELSRNERQFFQSLVKTLEDEKCFPIALRNYEVFPDKIGHDFDLFILKERLPDAVSQLLAITKEFTGKVVHIHERNYFLALWIQFPDSDEAIHLDYYHGPQQWHGIDYLEVSSLIEESKLFQSSFAMRIPSAVHEATTLLLSNLLWAGRIKEKYVPKIRELVAGEKEKKIFLSLLESAFGNEGKKLGKSLLVDETSPQLSWNDASRLRKIFVRRAFRRNTWNAFKGWVSHWRKEVSCYLHEQPGFALQIAKHDHDSGMVQQIEKALAFYFGEVVVVKKEGNFLMRWLRCLRAKGKNQLYIEVVADLSPLNLTELIKLVKERNQKRAEKILTIPGKAYEES